MQDSVFGRLSLFISLFASSIIIIVAVVLFRRSLPILESQSLFSMLFSSSWNPELGNFGYYPFIMGTVYVTALAMVFSIPICILSSIYISEFAPKKVRGIIMPIIDLLASIPSVVIGLWGILFIVPFIRYYVAPAFGAVTTGYSILAGGFVLAIMVSPIIISVSHEVLRTIPSETASASLALGATKWETVKHVLLRKAMPGILAAIILGFSRAFGETMAMVMVLGGNVSAKAPTSLFDTAITLPTLIANNYGDLMSVPMYESALLLAALALLVVVAFFNILARIVLRRVEARSR